MAHTEGLRIGERYVLQERIGSGGFGEVWRTEDTHVGKTVAVKLLRRELAGSEEARARFAVEAEALGMLSHPNLVAATDRGEHEGRPFLVMEHVEGISLAAWLEEHRAAGRWPALGEVEAIFEGICAGVAAAHAVKDPGAIVHRDLKPQNVMLARRDGGFEVKVLDFGIARLGERGGTRTGQVLGTGDYMAPEQKSANPAGIGAWTDVFSLGVLLVEMISLRATPRPQACWWAAAMGKQGEIRGLLEEMRRDVPWDVWDVVARALRSEGGERWQDAGKLGAALRPAWRGRTRSALRWLARKAGRRARGVLLQPRVRRGVASVLAVVIIAVGWRPARRAGWPEWACEAGEVGVCAELGRRYEAGDGVPRDLVRAAKRYEDACTGKVATACTHLAGMYEAGRGVPRDEGGERSRALYTTGCNGDDFEACFRLGIMIEEARGWGSHDKLSAQLYHRRSCQGGYQPACERLSEWSRPEGDAHAKE